MKLQNQVCSLESAKRLKELGIKQKSLFKWVDGSLFCELQSVQFITPDEPEIYSAFTVAELGEILPLTIIYENYYTYLVFKKETNNFTVEYWPYADRKYLIIEDKIEAEARAKMLIYLIENKMVAPDGI